VRCDSVNIPSKEGKGKENIFNIMLFWPHFAHIAEWKKLSLLISVCLVANGNVISMYTVGPVFTDNNPSHSPKWSKFVKVCHSCIPFFFNIITVEPRLSGPRLSGLFDYPDFFSGPVFFHEY